MINDVLINNNYLLARKKDVRSGIRTHAWRTRLRPERSALDHSAILTVMKNYKTLIIYI